ncbi:terpenoid cyclases/Protein prenyltransferase [Pseudovirgaria hyperparasitica]|uniref:Protein farnesyltransferase subunit beta n=1 Tax=Pseudovirgaria hyperparasitica TaxID=470096 RepID=A0A6A6VUQ5_9PEZI|nr:terpenoid cyclases/Protein prenyltransferase [Pseudovirgaria hyperparasitica]KAF2753885.1 terpenoid cyclases/Protein prenyltransferase [Pseudovirgaria hyperparasitica]
MASSTSQTGLPDLYSRIEELSVSDDGQRRSPYPPIPALYTSRPIIQDSLSTESSEVQDGVIRDCLPFLEGNPNKQPLNSRGIQALQRDNHVEFLKDALEDYPAGFVAVDASRPWIYYWSLSGLAMLGENLDKYRQRLISNLLAAQNSTGGFGGGHGQYSHVAGSYAGVLSLAILGGKECYDMIDRKAMWEFLGNMKQRDGGFTVAPGAEEDIRGAYCAMTIVSLLNLPLELPKGSPARVNGDETFFTGLPEWISRCQSFEGGIGASPGNEAHGAYAFCALACLSLIGAPYEMIPKYLDIHSLTAWLSSQQHAPEGGFAGRTNKLVDGCYSHWVGGCWSMLECAIWGPDTHPRNGKELWSKNGLARWILCCCQGKNGGLRDKPKKHPDAYHTCYNLAGLCAAQFQYVYRPSELNPFANAPLSAAFSWTIQDSNSNGVLETCPATDEQWCWDEKDLLKPVHPVFVIPLGQADKIRGYFEAKGAF